MKWYTIYRIDTDDWKAAVWKQISGTPEDVNKEIRKVNGYTRKYPDSHLQRHIFVAREEQPQIIIPV